jgi:PAS domain S-box-containing protein
LIHPVEAPELLATVRALLRIARTERERTELLQRAEAARAEAEQHRERLRSLFLQAPAMINMHRGPDHVFELAHPLTRQFFGDRQLEGRPAREALPEPAMQPLLSALDRVYRTGETFQASELPIPVQRDGRAEIAFLDVVVQPLRDENGRIQGAVTFAVDVSSQVAARSRLEESEQRFRFLADSIPTLVWVSREDGEVEYYNARWQGYTGLSFDELSKAWDVVHPDDRAGVTAAWQASLQTGVPFEAQARMRRKDGQYRWFINRALPQHDSTGRVARWFGTCTDIDDQKQTQQALEQSAEFREQLLGIVGHDLRNPLASVTMAAATMLKRGALTETDSRTTARIATSADRMARIIEQVLDFTRSRLGGGIPIAPAPVDLEHVSRQVLDELEVAHPDRELRLDVRGDPRGNWDGQRLGQVVSNLVGNAVAHGKPGGRIDVALRGSADHVELAVHNEGPPIPAEMLPVIFEPFRSGKPRSPSSLGLGLFIVRQIVHAHGGSIDVRSVEGDGTTFTLRLPRRAEG